MRVAVGLATGGAGGERDAPAGFPRDRSRWTAVIVDILRASTTLTVALAHGAAGVEPLATPDEALARRAAVPGMLACGERGGRIVPGFDLGNSPLEFSRERVAGRRLAFASTNGSRGRRVLGAFINAAAVRDTLANRSDEFVLIACAGTLGRVSLEDVAFAGWLCAELERRGARLVGPQARLARALAPRDAGEVRAAVEGSSNGRRLRRMAPGYARDVEFCAALDTIGTAFTL